MVTVEVHWIQARRCWHPPAELLAALESQVPPLKGVSEELEEGFLAQTHPLVGSWGPLSRPYGHWRAFYFCQSERGCLAYKGSEVYCPDLGDWWESMQQRYADLTFSIDRPGQRSPLRSATVSVAERFLFFESKFPGAVLLQEALSEASRAADFQRDCLSHSGQLARVPFPLAVYEVDPSRCRRVVEGLGAVLDHHPGAADRLRLLAEPGLGMLVYWMPELPHRVAHLELSPELTPTQRMQHLAGFEDPAVVIARWTHLMAQFLRLERVPCDPREALRGTCLEPQNLTLDGGIVDLDSLRPFGSFRSPAELHLALERSFQILAGSVAQYLTGDPTLADDWGALRQEVLERCRALSHPHPALADLLACQNYQDFLTLKAITRRALA